MRVLVVGLGKMGRLHAAALGRSGSTTGTVDVAGHADFESITDALEHDWDAAVIATPIGTLWGAAMLTLDARIPTLVEKPGSATAEQARAIAEFSEERETMLTVGWIERYNPAVTAVRSALGELGDPVVVESRRFGPTRGVNPTIDLAVHDIDLANFLEISAPHHIAAEDLPHRKERSLIVNCAYGAVEADLRRHTVHVWRNGDEHELPVMPRDALQDEQAAFLVAAAAGRPAPCPMSTSVSVLRTVEGIRQRVAA